MCKVDNVAKPESQTQFKRNAKVNKMKSLEVRADVIKITQERLKHYLQPKIASCQTIKSPTLRHLQTHE